MTREVSVSDKPVLGDAPSVVTAVVVHNTRWKIFVNYLHRSQYSLV